MALTLQHILKIRLARDDLERMVSQLPDDLFDTAVKGCTVKVLLEEENQARVYRIAWITGVDTAATYNFGTQIKTSKTLVLDFAIFKMSYQMNTISNSEFTEEEFRQWIRTCEGTPPFNAERAEKKAAELQSICQQYPEATPGRRSPPRSRRPAAAASARVPLVPQTVLRAPRPGDGLLSLQLTTILEQFFAANSRITTEQKQLVTSFGTHVEEYIAKEKQKVNHMHAAAAAAAAAASAAAERPPPAATSAETGLVLQGDIDTMAIDQLRHLVSQIEEMRKRVTDKIDEKSKCVICTELDARIVLLPCKHQVLCKLCADKVQDCPYCRTRVTERLDPWRP